MTATTVTAKPLAFERWDVGLSGEVQLRVRPPLEGNDAPPPGKPPSAESSRAFMLI